MIDSFQIRQIIIKPALESVDLYTPEAEELVFYTGLVESRYKYVAQIQGPARSFWQIEPFTANDHFNSYLNFRKSLEAKVRMLMAPNHGIEWNLTNSLAFAVVMCRLKYRRSKLKIPSLGDTKAQAYIWKTVYNTAKGAGTEKKFIQMVNDYNDF